MIPLRLQSGAFVYSFTASISRSGIYILTIAVYFVKKRSVKYRIDGENLFCASVIHVVPCVNVEILGKEFSLYNESSQRYHGGHSPLGYILHLLVAHDGRRDLQRYQRAPLQWNRH